MDDEYSDDRETYNATETQTKMCDIASIFEALGLYKRPEEPPPVKSKKAPARYRSPPRETEVDTSRRTVATRPSQPGVLGISASQTGASAAGTSKNLQSSDGTDKRHVEGNQPPKARPDPVTTEAAPSVIVGGVQATRLPPKVDIPSTGSASSLREGQLVEFERCLSQDGIDVVVYLTTKEGQTKSRRACVTRSLNSTTVYCEIYSKHSGEKNGKKLKFDLIDDVMMVSKGRGSGRGEKDAKVPKEVDNNKLLHFSLRGKPELNMEFPSQSVRDDMVNNFMALIKRHRSVAASNGRFVA